MTREEAIEILQLIRLGKHITNDEALEMAINALSQEPQCTEHPCLGTLCRYYKDPCDKCAMKNSGSNYCKNCMVTEYHGKKVSVPTKFVEQQPCTDAVSREAVIELCGYEEYLIPYERKENGHTYKGYDKGRIINYTKLTELPSVTQKSGKWIETEYHRWRCSVCREKGMSDWDNIHDVRTNFCPNCGARMFEPQESEDKA